jgi:hypothetical protein
LRKGSIIPSLSKSFPRQAARSSIHRPPEAFSGNQPQTRGQPDFDILTRNPILLHARPKDPNQTEFQRLAKTWGSAGAAVLEDRETLEAAVGDGCRILVVSVRPGDALDFLDTLRVTSFDFRLILLLPPWTKEETPDLLDAAYAKDPWLVLRGEKGLKILPEILSAMVRTPVWRPEDAVRLNGGEPAAPTEGDED